MATQWYYKALGQEFGPVQFGELVRMVREGVLTEDDQVRADWDEAWRWADSVPGLCYMARHAAAEPAAARPCPRTPADKAEPSAETESSGLFQDREVRPHHRSEGRPAASASYPDSSAAANGKSRVGAAITAALAALDHRAEARTGGRWRRWTTPLGPALCADAILRGACALLAANLVGYAVINWSETESLRFPDRKAAAVTTFPLWGPCGPWEYGFLLADTMAMSGALGYGAARLLERYAEG